LKTKIFSVVSHFINNSQTGVKFDILSDSSAGDISDFLDAEISKEFS
jgi:hypothetical protein